MTVAKWLTGVGKWRIPPAIFQRCSRLLVRRDTQITARAENWAQLVKTRIRTGGFFQKKISIAKE
jgi:hypothetical protein